MNTVVPVLMGLALIFLGCYTLRLPNKLFDWLGAGLFCWCLWAALGGRVWVHL